MNAGTKAHIVAVTIPAGAAMLYRFPPQEYGFYPRCPIFRYFHLYCPGCGATRALAALLHLRVGEALHYNALLVGLLPVLFIYFALAYGKAVRSGNFALPEISPTALKIFLAAAAVFAAFRNALGVST